MCKDGYAVRAILPPPEGERFAAHRIKLNGTIFDAFDFSFASL
ncbi:hypothetical protein [Cupriavidus sp. CuC1]